MRVAERLLPVNAFVALFQPNDLWPPLLRQAGFRLVGLEVPVTTPHGSMTLDGVAVHEDTNLLLVAECKSGANIDIAQARKLTALDPAGIVRTASVTLTAATNPTVGVVYVCQLEHLPRILQGLAQAGVASPVLAVGPRRIEHHGGPFTVGVLTDVFRDLGDFAGPPPGIIRFDEECTADEFGAVVLSELVAMQSHQRSILTVRALTEAVIPQYALYGKRAQSTFAESVGAAVKRIAQDRPDNYRYRPRTEGHQEPAVEILRSPEDLDPRGRTQAYQAIGRPPRRHRKGMPPPAGQLELDLATKELERLEAAEAGDGAEEEED